MNEAWFLCDDDRIDWLTAQLPEGVTVTRTKPAERLVGTFPQSWVYVAGAPVEGLCKPTVVGHEAELVWMWGAVV